MASIFIRATNTGVGFITPADSLGFTIKGVGDDVYEVSGDYQAWVARVGGVEVVGYATVLQKQALQRQIDNLETSSKMNSFVRKAMVLLSVQQAATLGLTELQLYAANVGYRMVKDLDTQITALESARDIL